jgi:hypothetical protein
VRPLQVYSWAGWYQNHIQTNEVVAAHSLSEVARLAGVSSPARLHNLTITANEVEIVQAMTRPLTIFWHRVHQRPPVWRAR